MDNPTDDITLTISAPEARTVAQVLGLVGGCPHRSPRRHLDRVLRALRDAGIEGDAGRLEFNHESLWFAVERPSHS